MFDKRVIEMARRLLEIPGLIAPLEKQRTAFRAERRTVEGKLRRQASLVQVEALGEEAYRSASNQRERDLLLEAALFQDDTWVELTERVDQLSTALDKVDAELRVLDHERKALKAVLEREYAEVLSAHLSDQVLTDVATSRRLPGARA